MKLDLGHKDYQTIGKDLPDCSGKPRPAVWRQIPGPKLKQITVGPKVNILFLQIPDYLLKGCLWNDGGWRGVQEKERTRGSFSRCLHCSIY